MIKINVYSNNGSLVGYFVDPQIQAFGQDEYEIIGRFFDETGQLTTKIDFNPQSLPYVADLSKAQDLPHNQLKHTYVQRGRQPVRMTGVGTKTSTSQ